MKTLLLALTSLVIGAFLIAIAVPAEAAEQAEFSYPEARDFRVIAYQIAGTGGRGEAPVIEIYGDGTVLVTNNGERLDEFSMPPVEVSRLVSVLRSSGALEAVTRELRAQARAVLKAEAQARAVERGQDPETVAVTLPGESPVFNFSIHLDFYQPRFSESRKEDFRHSVAVKGLSYLAREAASAVPEIGALQEVVETVKRHQKAER